METPSSTRRVTRSQNLSALNNNIPISRKVEDSEKSVSKSRQRNGKQQEDRTALVDVTNDSPIVGLATGSLQTPSSGIAKQRNSRAKNGTPGSGEALLRGQVKTLLQKVEEEAELSKISLESRPFLHLQGFVNSPAGLLLAPTPANTPHVPNLSGDGSIKDYGLASGSPLEVVEEQLIPQMVGEIFDGKQQQESLESHKSLTRSLMLDFSEKSEGSDSSESKEKSNQDNDDEASTWSVEVNASSHDDEDSDEEEEDEDDGDGDGGLLDALCEGLSKISVKEKFEGKHTRFVYNSDDEIVEECAESEDLAACVSPSVLVLKGLPTPKGKHLRFPVEEEEA